MLRARRVAAGVALGAAALLGLPSPALASPSSGVRVWSVWQSDGTAWLAATSAYAPADGSVVGWRFSASPDASGSEPPGGELPTFASVCGQDTAGSGHKRVALAVDFGDGDDARPGDEPPARGVLRCVAGAEDATVAQLLASAARVHVNARGEVVSVSGYPPAGAAASELAPAPVTASAGGPPTLPIALGAGALLLLAAALLAARRRPAHPTTPANP